MEDEEWVIGALVKGKFKKLKFWKYPQHKSHAKTFLSLTWQSQAWTQV